MCYSPGSCNFNKGFNFWFWIPIYGLENQVHMLKFDKETEWIGFMKIPAMPSNLDINLWSTNELNYSMQYLHEY